MHAEHRSRSKETDMDFQNTDRLCREAVDTLAFPSLVIAAGDADGVYFKKAYGYSRVIMNEDRPEGVFSGKVPDTAIPATLDTLYDMASLSKLMSTTMVALQLIREGYITLYDSVGSFFPDAPDDKKGINVLDLMTHQSGITPHFALYRECGSADDIYDAILKRPLSYTPHEKTAYSCMGFILLARMLELARGMSLSEMAKKYVFEPLGMKHTGYNPLKDPVLSKMNIAATEWSPTLERYKVGEVHDENAMFSGGEVGNAGVFSCIDDMCIFAKMLASRGKHEGGIYLPEALFDAATENRTPQGPEYRGLGFQLTTPGINAAGDLFSPLSYGHNGFTGTSLYVDRKTGFFLVLLTNRVHFTRESNRLFRFRRACHNTAFCDYLTRG